MFHWSLSCEVIWCILLFLCMQLWCKVSFQKYFYHIENLFNFHINFISYSHCCHLNLKEVKEPPWGKYLGHFHVLSVSTKFWTRLRYRGLYYLWLSELTCGFFYSQYITTDMTQWIDKVYFSWYVSACVLTAYSWNFYADDPNSCNPSDSLHLNTSETLNVTAIAQSVTVAELCNLTLTLADKSANGVLIVISQPPPCDEKISITGFCESNKECNQVKWLSL